MKKIILILTAFAALNSCNDAIEIIQDGEYNTPDIAITNVKELRNFLNGNVYGVVNPLSEIAFTSIFTDEVGFGPSSVSNEQILTHRFVLNSGTSYASNIWAHHYNIINKVNILMAAAENLDYDAMTPADKLTYTNILAHARALRAYAYTTLLSYYSPDMKNPNALGVIISDKPADVFQSGLSRSTNAEVFAVISADIQFALDNINIATINSNVSPQHLITKNAINAIAARFNLYRGNYVEAKTFANNALSGLGLSNINVYPAIWTDAQRGEVIFSASRPTAGTWSNIASIWATNTTSLSGSINLDMGRNLFNLLNNNPGDIRRTVFVDESSIFEWPTSPDPRNNDVIVINKYPGKGSTPLRNDIKLFRISEMYFILAEVAAIHDNDLAAAANYIRLVRQARTNSPQTVTFANLTVAANEILKERRMELCFEGHRYVDIKRLGTLAGVGVDRDPTDDTLDMSQPTTLPASDYRFTMPIPLPEINANPNVQQNPNYN